MGTTVVQDAWLDVNYSPKARVRWQVQVPVGLERLQSPPRWRSSSGLPDRDRSQPRRGRDASRRPRGGVLAYAAACSTGARRGSVDLDSPTARTWPAASFSRPSSGAAAPSRTWGSDRRHDGEADRCASGLSLRRPGQPPDLVQGIPPTERATASRHSSPSTRVASGSWRSSVVGVVGAEGLDRHAGEVQRRSVAGDRHLHPHRREGVLLGPAPGRGLRARPGEVGRPRARGPRERPRGRNRGLP